MRGEVGDGCGYGLILGVAEQQVFEADVDGAADAQC